MPGLQASVAIPALNEERYLPALLQSLCEQQEVTLDVVVVEARSEDQTVAAANRVIAANGNPNVNIRLFTVDQRNVSFQRNYAISRTRFEHLFFLDSDVRLPHRYWARDVLRKHLYHGAAVSTCRFVPSEPHLLAHLYYAILYVFHQAMRAATPYALGAMLLTSRRVYDRLGGFNPELTLNEDANFVKRASRLGRFDVLPDACFISARRLLKGGFFKTGLLYLRIFLHRTLHGEMQHDMGYWSERGDDLLPQ